MNIEEKLEVINKVQKTKIAKYLGVSRQAITNRINEKRCIDEMYQVANSILNGIKKENIEEKMKIEINMLKNVIAEKNNEISQLKKENLKLIQLKESNKYNELKRKYIDLMHRYNSLSDYKLLQKAGKPLQRKCEK